MAGGIVVVVLGAGVVSVVIEGAREAEKADKAARTARNQSNGGQAVSS